jgi:hypothetical protein
MSNDAHTDSWYLMYSSFPNLNWARLRVFASGLAEVFDCDGRTTKFKSRQEAVNWLLEDEFCSFEKLNEEDEAECGIVLKEIVPPAATTESELKAKMYVTAKKA